VHFYQDQSKESEEISRKSHPVNMQANSLAFNAQVTGRASMNAPPKTSSLTRTSSNTTKGDRFIPVRGTDPFQYEHALLQKDLQKRALKKKAKESRLNNA
jgi:hypothetical protein